MVLKADVIDYMGKMEGGILVLLSVNLDGKFSEGTIFYTEDNFAITVAEEIEDALGTKIEAWDGYAEFAASVLKKLIPCRELITRIDDVDFSKYLDYDGDMTFIEGEIDPDDIEEIE